LSKPLFKILGGDLGKILDIGGGSFYKSLRNSNWSTYVVLEPNWKFLPKNVDSKKVVSISADSVNSPLKDSTFDTVLIIQVLQFIYEPVKLISEVSRVLKRNGKLVIQVPQSGNLHGVPYHYYNFTRFWLERVLIQNQFKVIDYVPLGGAWRTIASRLFLMYWPVFRHSYYFDEKFKNRGLIFWLFFPIQFFISIVFFVISLIFSLIVLII
jgi:SAM-dependent methyltransferase